MRKEHHSFLLYGATGYTGKLIAHYAKYYHLIPVLAGRSEGKLAILAKELNTTYHVISLSETEKLENLLSKFSLVLHAAGPFVNTAKKMIDACIKTNTHYIDITGEIAVFELAKKMGNAASNAGIMLLPGVGFDVVPTDCIALSLKTRLPDATSLKLAFASLKGGLSHGTSITMINGLGEMGAERKNGKIIRVPLGQKSKWIDFGLKKLFVMSIPWGDISTAFTTTNIGNIETYTRATVGTVRILKFQFLFNWILRSSIIRNFFKRRLGKKPAGPSDEQRAKSKSMVWGEVSNSLGRTVVARLTGPDGYTLTAYSSLIIAKKILEGNFKPGYQTPAGCYGEDLIMEIPEVTREFLK